MGNPHPTKSKPCKIGRKHTQAPSTRVREKRRAAKQKQREIVLAKFRKHKEQIAAYYRGEIEECPQSLLYSQKGHVFQAVYSSGERPKVGDIVRVNSEEHEVTKCYRTEVKLHGMPQHVSLAECRLLRRAEPTEQKGTANERA